MYYNIISVMPNGTLSDFSNFFLCFSVLSALGLSLIIFFFQNGPLKLLPVGLYSPIDIIGLPNHWGNRGKSNIIYYKQHHSLALYHNGQTTTTSAVRGERGLMVTRTYIGKPVKN